MSTTTPAGTREGSRVLIAPACRRRRRTREPRFALLLFLIGATLLSACGESERESEREAGARCPGQERVEPAGARLVTLFHETHTHGNLTTFAQYVGHLSALRACLPDPDNSLFLGNGDDISPGLGNVSTDGRHTVDAFNAAGLAANTFGFSEVGFGEHYDSFGEGLDLLRDLVAESDFAWVSANVRDRRNPEQPFAFEEGARRFVVDDVGGTRVGITGLLSPFGSRGAPDAPPPAGIRAELRVLDPVRAMREVVPKMRAAGAEVVVILSHLHEEETLRVVRSVDGIDAALGTHVGDATERPRVVNGAIVAVAGPMDLGALGELSLVVRDGEVVDFEFRRHLPAGDAYVDRDVQAVIDEYIRRG